MPEEGEASKQPGREELADFVKIRGNRTKIHIF